jgi:hypothetical protein
VIDKLAELKHRLRELRGQKNWIEANMCAAMIQALAWTLGQTGDVTHRVKVK